MSVGSIVQIAIGLLIPVLIFAVWVKRRSQRNSFDSDVETSAPSAIDEAALRRAEDAVRGTSSEIRENLLKTHDLLDRYSTIQGFSREYMDEVLEELRGKGIACEAYFQELVPVGVAMSVISAQGVYELYVQRDKFDQAQEIMRARLAKA